MAVHMSARPHSMDERMPEVQIKVDACVESATAVFMAQRPRLVKIAYRILGGWSEAEDVVQDVWIRWQRTDQRIVKSPPAFLATVTSRVAINVLHSARSRHETVNSPWLDDLVESGMSGDENPQTRAERADTVNGALRHLLERLNPAERGAYLLRTGFGYPYRDIACVLRLSDANSRQLVSRAQGRIRSTRRRPVSLDTHRNLVRAFLAASEGGELHLLEAALAADMERFEVAA